MEILELQLPVGDFTTTFLEDEEKNIDVNRRHYAHLGLMSQVVE